MNEVLKFPLKHSAPTTEELHNNCALILKDENPSPEMIQLYINELARRIGLEFNKYQGFYPREGK